MRLDKFIEGLQILSKYFNTPGHDLGAEHDQIVVYPTNHPISELDVDRLVELGWAQPNGVGRSVHGYDPNDSWACWV